MFHVPAGFHELNGEPIQQVGVGGRLGLGPEVLEGGHDSVAEQLRPPAVDRHPGSEGVVFANEPAGEVEAVAWGSLLQLGKAGGGVGGDLGIWAEEVAAFQDMRFTALLHLDHDEGLIGFDGIALLLEAGDPGIYLLKCGVFFFEVGAEFLLLGVVACVGRLSEDSDQVGRELGVFADLGTSGEAEVSNDTPFAPVLRQGEDEGACTCLLDRFDEFEGSPM